MNNRTRPGRASKLPPMTEEEQAKYNAWSDTVRKMREQRDEANRRLDVHRGGLSDVSYLHAASEGFPRPCIEARVHGELIRIDTGKRTARPPLRPEAKKRGAARYSYSSRRRFIRKLKTVDDRCKCFMVTLTYPSKFPDGVEAKRHLRAFLERVRRRWGQSSGFWKLEFQERGAPHFHLLFFGISYKELRAFVSQNWYEVVGSGDEKHLKAGTRVEHIKVRSGQGGIKKYVAKVTAEVTKNYQTPDIEVGRWWGIFNAKYIPWSNVFTMEITNKQAYTLIRYARRYAKVLARQYDRLTVEVCHPSQWLRAALLC